MPNWTYNTVTLSHDDPAMIVRAKNAFKRGEFFNEFIPIPEDQEESWYMWNIENYGTKWDVGGENEDCEEVDDNTLQLNFNSAWSPPIAGFRGLTDLGFDLTVSYIEEGEAFVGEYTSDNDNDHYDIEERTAEWVIDNIPSHLDERYGISERFREDEEWNKENNDDDDDYDDEDTDEE